MFVSRMFVIRHAVKLMTLGFRFNSNVVSSEVSYEGVNPEEIPNWINNELCPAQSGDWFDKYNPADGKVLCCVARSGAADVKKGCGSCRECPEGVG